MPNEPRHDRIVEVDLAADLLLEGGPQRARQTLEILDGAFDATVRVRVADPQLLQGRAESSTGLRHRALYVRDGRLLVGRDDDALLGEAHRL